MRSHYFQSRKFELKIHVLAKPFASAVILHAWSASVGQTTTLGIHDIYKTLYDLSSLPEIETNQNREHETQSKHRGARDRRNPR